jgi:hypothetical protein
VITYESKFNNGNGTFIIVRLDGKQVGPVFPTVAEVKQSLESDE